MTVNIFDLLDSLIPFAGGVFCFLIGFRPQWFARTPEALEKLQKRTKLMMVLGAALVVVSVAMFFLRAARGS